MSAGTAPPGDRVPAYLRTVVPALWGSLVAWLLGTVVLPDAVVEALTSEVLAGAVSEVVIAAVGGIVALVVGAWYALWRALEPRLPAWVVRLVLGSARSPRYVEHDPTLAAADLENVVLDELHALELNGRLEGDELISAAAAITDALLAQARGREAGEEHDRG